MRDVQGRHVLECLVRSWLWCSGAGAGVVVVVVVVVAASVPLVSLPHAASGSEDDSDGPVAKKRRVEPESQQIAAPAAPQPPQIAQSTAAPLPRMPPDLRREGSAVEPIVLD